MRIRKEKLGDYYPIQLLLERAFPTGHNTEARVLGGLRFTKGLSLSLVAVERRTVIGQIAISPVSVAGRDVGWKAIFPIAVAEEHRGQGIGSALIHEALEYLEKTGASGCVATGCNGFFEKFGFKPSLRLHHERFPWPQFQALSFGTDSEEGPVEFLPVFDIIVRS